MEDMLLVLDEGEELELVIGDGEGIYTPPYTGSYTVVSALYETQTMETNGKRMTDDVTIEPIPVTTTTNPYGGQTVVIG